MAAGVVAQHAAHVFGNRVEVAEQVVSGFAGELGMLLQSTVGVVDVRLVVLVVVEVHGLGINGGLERRVVVRKRWNFVCHLGNLLHCEL